MEANKNNNLSNQLLKQDNNHEADKNPNLPVSPEEQKSLRKKQIIIVSILAIIAIVVLAVMIYVLCCIK